MSDINEMKQDIIEHMAGQDLNNQNVVADNTNNPDIEECDSSHQCCYVENHTFDRQNIDQQSANPTDELVELKAELESTNRVLLRMEFWIMIPALISGLGIICLASFLEMPLWLQILLMVFGLALIVVMALVAVGIEQKAGYYECAKCGHRHKPTYKQTALAMHSGRTRYMVCPECGDKSWHKKALTK